MSASLPIESSTRPAARALQRTLVSPSIKRAQRRHAQAVTAIMVLGVLLACAGVLAGRPPDRIDLLLFLVSTLLVGLGSSIGFHRHFTHRSFKATTPVRVGLAVLGSMSMQGTLIFWVALHRRHHENSDRTGDPHSPHLRENGQNYASLLRGIWNAYIGWTFDHEVPNSAHYARDLIQDKVLSRINRLYFVWVVLGFALPMLSGAYVRGSWLGALDGFVYGGCLRILFWHHMIWSITSISHVIGRRDYHSSDRSTNIAWLALPTLGESWHNNHHAFPAAPSLHFKWYQLDLSGLLIRALALLGLAWDLKQPTAATVAGRARDHETDPKPKE